MKVDSGQTTGGLGKITGTTLLTRMLTHYGMLARPTMADDDVIETLIDKARAYHPLVDADLLRRAYAYAAEKHAGQTRRSGEPYITHPVAVATILTELEMDDATLAAGLLHDVVEDCGVTRDQVASVFGNEIADLVDGVTKLKLADFEARNEAEPGARIDAPPAAPELSHADAAEALARKKRHGETTKSAANLRKILLAMAKDLRVMVIKLADRLHNMRTLGAMPEHRQKKVAQETLQIFAPLAHRLGIWQIKWQLEDLAFKYTNPDAYNDLKQKLDRTRAQREKDIAAATETLKARLGEEGIHAEFQGRPKHLYSIYNKMQKQGLDLGEIYDQIALRVLVPTVAECYHTLGVVHQVWIPLPGRFDDYIARAKSNGYQSLHTKVIGPNGEPLEIQIRTTEMHRTADFGIAAHWQYKEGGGKTKGPGADKRFEKKMTLLRQQLFDWQSDAKEPGEFLRSVVSDLFTDQVFVFTPKGDVLDFPLGATPIDAAYRIHSDLGQHCAGAKVNGKIVPLTYHFKNGDIVEILHRPSANPSLDWLASAKTSHARTKIKAYFRKLRYAANVARGRELLQKELERLHLDARHLMSPDVLGKISEQTNHHGQEDLLASIGYGDTAVGTILTRLRALVQETPHEENRSFERKGGNSGKLQVGGDLEDVAMIRAKCCQPVPGDEVVGYMTRGKGIALHRHGCANVAHYQQTEPERLIEVDWKPSDPAQRYSTDIKIELVDRLGLLEDIGKLFSETKTFIQAIRTRSHPNHTAVMQVSFDAADTDHIAAMIVRLQRLTDVMDIHRLGANEDPVD